MGRIRREELLEGGGEVVGEKMGGWVLLPLITRLMYPPSRSQNVKKVRALLVDCLPIGTKVELIAFCLIGGGNSRSRATDLSSWAQNIHLSPS